MGAKLSPWCKEVHIKLIERDMSVSDLAEAVGMKQTYVSSIINGRQFTKAGVKRISDYLDISDSVQTTVKSV